MTLEELLKKYKFAPKSKQLFREKRIYIDDLPDDLTKEGHKAYGELISLLYDISKLTGRLIEVNKIVENLDYLTTENY